jgi:predicted thioredoxin/glutaredoxin
LEIKVYWREHCSSCNEVFRYFDQKHITYEKINVTHDQKHFSEMLRLGGFATPFILIDDQVISYFDSIKMDRILEVYKL